MNLDKLDNLVKKVMPTVQVCFHVEANTYNQFIDLANKYGHGSRRLILETALKEYLERNR